MGIVKIEAEGTRHSKMQDHLEVAIEWTDEELAAPLHILDRMPHRALNIDEFPGHLWMRIRPDLFDRSADELRCQLSADRLDLRKFGHSLSVGRYLHEMAPDNRMAKKEDIDAGTFFSVDQRVGRVVEVRAFPEARKPAWKLKVDFGPEIGLLQTSAQITNYTEEELMGRLVVGVVNLGKKRIAGFSSEFLVLGSIAPDGTVLLLKPEEEALPGARIA